MKSFAARFGLALAKPLLSEAKSAKAPGRPVFDEMMKRVESGKIRGILCWKLDRLARNPVDGGRIIWAIKQHGLVIRTPTQTFSQEEDNLILMYIEFGMAHKYVDDLSSNTERGLESKARKGWRPGAAPLGYLNSKVEERGQKTILKDPQRFKTVRRMWDLMLSGNYNPAKIQKIANEEWGFVTRLTKQTGGRSISRSAVYKIFSDPFYYGQFEYPKRSGLWYPSQHEPMITKAEFERVQKLLHRETNPRSYKEFALPFRGIIRCGECESSITAHFKAQVRCTQCGFKSSVKNRSSCSNCRLPISEMKAPNIRRYAYYHCTQTLNPECRQKCISAEALEKQVAGKLKAFGLPRELRDWGLQYIEKLRDRELNKERDILAEKKTAYAQCVARLENLVRLKTAPANADGSLLSDEKYQKQRTELIAQRNRMATNTEAFQEGLERKMQITKHALDLALSIQEMPQNDDPIKNREILMALGLNHALKDKNLKIRPEFPFFELTKTISTFKNDSTVIEPENNQSTQRPDSHIALTLSPFERQRYDDRTRPLKDSLETVWNELEPNDPALRRHPFDEDAPAFPLPLRGTDGRFKSPRNADDLL